MKKVVVVFLLSCLGALSCLAADDPKVRYSSELERLVPHDPAGYLELAEEILDDKNDHDVRKLAIELCVMAHHLDIHDGGGTLVSSSACALLAAIPGNEAHAKWLRVISRMLADESPDSSGDRTDVNMIDYALRYRIATLLGQLRSGDGAAAKAGLSKTDIIDSIRSLESMFISLGIIADPDELGRQASRWPCPDCGNERIVRRIVAGSGQSWRICASCGGVPGPRMFRSELLSSLRVESALLEGEQRSWAAQLSMDFGAPLVDPVPEAVALVFRIDPKLCVFRDGRWSKPE
jgi:predicted RNA-binding Zn-ribbon protein involved in translation (DUF1610 family)